MREGLAEGELVVSRGNFQIDSALQIQAQPSMMNPDRGRELDGPPHEHVGGDAAETIRGLVAAALTFTEALAADDAAKAGAAVAELVAAGQSLQQVEVPVSLNDTVEHLAESAMGLDAEATIEKHREALDNLSQALTALLQAAHVEGLGPTYRAHCPMAFDNRGASWLTPEEEVFNPYFGDRMLRCGSIEETLSTPTPGPGRKRSPVSSDTSGGGGDPHAGH